MLNISAIVTAAALVASLLGTATATSAEPDARRVQAPRIINPPADVEEVPGRWRGPIKVNFTGVLPGTYIVDISCASGYSEQLAHTAPEDGEELSAAIPPLPAKDGCGTSVASATDENAPGAWREVVTTGANFALDDLTAPRVFYPRTREDFLDDIRLDYWLTQPATVSVEVLNSAGKRVATFSRRHRYYGGNGVTWDGVGDSGRVPAAGRYTAVVKATNLDGLVVSGRVAFYLADPVRFRPGRVEGVRVGMTVEEAMATGQFDRNVRYTVPGVCTKVYALQAKAPHEFTYSVFVKNRRVVEMTAAARAEVALPQGLRRGSTAAQVRRAYDGRVSTGDIEYANNALFVRTGRRWIAFGFTSYSYDRPLRSYDRLRSVAVSVGSRPPGRTHDGC